MARQKYYSCRYVLQQVPDAFYYVIFGERSNGKTYSVLDYALEDYFKNGNQLAIVRRYKEDLKEYVQLKKNARFQRFLKAKDKKITGIFLKIFGR